MQKNPFSAIFLFIIGVISSSFSQPTFIKHDITNNFAYPHAVYVADVNSDGFLDLVAAAWNAAEIAWWQNDGYFNFTKHTIKNQFTGARYVQAADLDNDGDMDIVAVAREIHSITWWENDGNEQFTEHPIDTNFRGAAALDARDVDRDGDMDLIAVGWYSAEVAWWENRGDRTFEKHSIALFRLTMASFVQGVDLDRDGDLDVLGVGLENSDVIWWENDGSQNFTAHTIDRFFNGGHTVMAKDLDLDGDIDVIGAAYTGGEFTWWQNDGQMNFSRYTIDNTLAGAIYIDAADLDRDGDMDLVGCAEISGQVLWWQNDGQQNFTQFVIDRSYARATCVVPIDLDGDDDIDIVATGAQQKISWWQNELYNLSFKAEPNSGHAPLIVQFRDLSTTSFTITSWSWDFDGDGTIDAQEPNPVWNYSTPGSYSVRLTIANDSMAKTITYNDYIRVFDGASAIAFDGNNGSIRCPATPALNLTGTFTIEAWVKPSGWGKVAYVGFGRIIDKQRFVLFLAGYHHNFNENSLNLQLFHADGVNSISMTPQHSIALDIWQHVAVTYDAGISAVTIYINGIEQSLTQTKTPSGSIADNSTSALIIGNNQNQNYTFDGIIDEVRLYNVILDHDAINAHMNNYLSGTEPGLVGNWQMNEGNGDTLKDHSGNGHHGIVINSRWAQGISLDIAPVQESATGSFPQSYNLSANYPNPFNAYTTIRLGLPVSSPVQLAIYNGTGALVTILVQGKMAAGTHAVRWSGTNGAGDTVSSGIYFCKMTTKEFSATQKMLFLK